MMREFRRCFEALSSYYTVIQFMQYEVLSERRAIWQRFMKYSNTSESLKDNRDFQKVYQYGKSAANRTLVLYMYPRAEKMRQLEQMPYSWKVAGYTKNRVGISVSKKVGNSVVRHHLTRLVRESYRLHETEFVKGLDLIVLVRPGAKESDFFTVERALLSLARRAEITEYNAEKGGGHEEIHDVVHL